MTRYARATGSKSSNVRMPNDATPWHVMKQQLEINKTRNQEQPPEKVKTVKQLLSENVNTNHNSWADFDDVRPQQWKKEKVDKTKATSENQETQKPKKLRESKEKKHQSEIQQLKNVKDAATNEAPNKNTALKRKTEQIDDTSGTQNNKKSKKGKTNETVTGDDRPLKGEKKINSITENNETDATVNVQKKKSKKRKQSSSNPVDTETNETCKVPDNGNKNTNQNDDGSRSKPEGILTKRQKRNLKHRNKKGEKDDNQKGSLLKPKYEKSSTSNWHTNNGLNKPDWPNSQKKPDRPSKNNHLTPAKLRDNNEHKRRKPAAPPTKVIINGVEVEITTYDGFPVRKEDADRLHDLKKQMIMKGIPKKDIEAALKLERRRAEKALARIKKEVCYHCRKSGHMLSDCPELGTEESGTGICFKCGSTEHTHFECKVARPTEFRFAKCFICREQGHIAKQCPDNPRGVYPQGGACKICGDVTHLKKDCPDLIQEKEQATITVDTLDNSMIESLDHEKKDSRPTEKISKSKIVKF